MAKKDKAKNQQMNPHNKRRRQLGVHVHYWDNSAKNSGSNNSADFVVRGAQSGYIRIRSADQDIFDETALIARSERWKLLKRAKSYLSRRAFDQAKIDELSPFYQKMLRRKSNPTLLDYFPGLKYSYSAPLPVSVLEKRNSASLVKGEELGYLDLCCTPDGSSRKARVSEISRSHSIRLDPVDAPKQLFLYRKRIQRCISWAYCNGLVPIMMTLTIFHRWHPLAGLLNVLKKAWNYFFTGTRAAVERAKRMGLQGYIRRAEETINNGASGFNSGWHPHYHVILFIPRENLSLVSSMEQELRDEWFKAVNRYFEAEFGESIDPTYNEAFRLHGLTFSRGFSLKGHRRRSVSPCNKTRSDDDAEEPLRPVDDGEYMAKVMGCSSYSGDSEMSSSMEKDSRLPFDLLREDTAENVDLWVEYALATKGVMSFFFAHGLEKCVEEYFLNHPVEDIKKDFVRSDKVVAQLNYNVYQLVYGCSEMDVMLKSAAQGYDELVTWFRQFYVSLGLADCDITEEMLPLPPDSRYRFRRTPMMFWFDDDGCFRVSHEEFVDFGLEVSRQA